jgi:collagen type III alpha
MDVPFELWGQRGWAGVDIVGESHYADAIRDVFGPDFRESGCELATRAQLVPEPWNPHDRNAVGVWVSGRQVGYLSRDDAARYAPALSTLVAEGRTPQVAARVWASAGYDDRPGIIGSVRLDLAAPHLIVPANRPPGAAHRVLPFGNAIQVTGEEKHLDALLPWLRPEGECWVHVTLHEIREQLPRSTRELLEVRIDRVPVGRLTPKMSAELLPAVRHLAQSGHLTAARALVRGNRIKIEVVLHAARAHELPDSWLTPSDVTVVALAPLSPPNDSNADRPVTFGLVGSGPANGPVGAVPVGGLVRGGDVAGQPGVGFGGLVRGGEGAGQPRVGAVGGDVARRPGAGVVGGGEVAGRPGVGAGAAPVGRAAPAGDPGSVTVERPAGVAKPVVIPGAVHAAEPMSPGRPAEPSLGGSLRPAVASSPSAEPSRGAHSADPSPVVTVVLADTTTPEPARHPEIPPRPAGIRFAVPPGWPQPPAGWSPPPGWRPDPAWPPAPPDWQWWVPFWS